MRVRGLIAVCAVLLFCGTPLASAMTNGSSRTLAGSPPEITVPNDFSVEATNGVDAVVEYTVTVTDIDDDLATWSCNPASGDTLAIGPHTVSCDASDAAGNNSSSSFTVTVTTPPPPPDTTAPTITTPGTLSFEATSNAGAAISYSVDFSDPDDAVSTSSCAPASGSTLGVGSHTVTCNASDSHSNSSSASFTVNVVDTTPPAVDGVPDVATTTTNAGGKVINYPTPTANDSVDGSVPVNCTKDSGETFPVGHTLVVCSATDAHSNTGSSSFNVDITLVDDTAPVLSGGPANISTTTESPTGKVINYVKPTANDNIDGPLPVSCTTEPGATFPVGHTHVVCSATDAHGNTGSDPFDVDITLVDTTNPVLSGVPGMIAENTQVPSGKVISYTPPTANDNLDGSLPVTCTKASGTNFAVGTTQVTCSATDAHSNTGSATFNVVITLIDITKPLLSNVPADITTEANGPSGSKANFVPPTAVDNLDGPIPGVPCSPLSGSTFPLGETTVTCSATDAHGNTGTATFKVKVVDTTAPTLIAPGNTSVYATSTAGSDPADQGPITRFIFGFNVSDIADPSPKVTANSPPFFPVGTTTVIFTATDASGNKSTASAKLTVLPKPEPGTTPPPLPPPSDNKPPGNVQSVVGKGGDGRASFKWTNPTDADFDHTQITRTTNLTSTAGTVVYSGKGTTYTDRGLQNGSEYRYVIASVDKSGNKSAGVAIVVVPKKAFLKTPADGARLKQIPKRFVWLADPKAAYYNLQLYAGGTLLFKSTAADPKKILSTWTTKPTFVFKSPWKWEGRTYKIAKGIYTWYVWPGYGAREAANYGALMGSATFQVTPTKPKKKPK
jgi:HYR domain-containing protein